MTPEQLHKQRVARLEKRVQKVLDGIDGLAELSQYPDLTTYMDRVKIAGEIQHRVNKAMCALANNRDTINFTLSSSSGESG